VTVRGARIKPRAGERGFDVHRRYLHFNPTAVNRVWCADITQIRTWEGWLYVASVMDCYSRRIVGWAIADHMRKELVIDALTMAVARRRPDAGVLHHSEHGSQPSTGARGVSSVSIAPQGRSGC
jgi:putative transposase